MVKKPTYQQIAGIIGIGLLFFLSIQLLGLSFRHMSTDIATAINVATSNPFIGLFIGLLTTAILQSSSTTTSMAVAAVAAGSISLQGAIPIIMGANIGTTLTSTIVSMSYITKEKEFRKALSAGTAHDIFNILLVVLLFPLEYNYGFLTFLSQSATDLITIGHHSEEINQTFIEKGFISQSLSSIVAFIGPLLSLIIAIALLFTTVKMISSLLYSRLIGETKEQFRSVVFRNTGRSFGWGILLTSLIQSSSLTTSLIVPLVATSKVKLKRAFQFILGANLGTTITALLAALFKSEAAISLALAHFLFNAIGITLFLGIPFLRDLPVYLAKKLGWITLKHRVAGFVYIIFIFFLLPFTLIYFSTKDSDIVKQTTKVNIKTDNY
ncbi:MAG: Na/Pi symporter [Cyclobacteriaceae bacterium]